MARTVSAVKELSGASGQTLTTLYTVPAKNTGLWNVLYVLSTSNNETPKVYWHDSNTSTDYLVAGAKNLGPGEYILLSDAHVALQENDQIRIQNTGTYPVTYIATIELRPAEAIQFHS